MTTVTPFAPTANGPFQFQATLDTVVYNITVTWNVYGQRWYVNITDQGGNLIVCLPLIGSVPSPDPGISLTAGYFTSTLVFRQALQQFEVSP